MSPPSGNLTIKLRNTIIPERNTRLTGLYVSSGIYSTQCDAVGLRAITYTYDRPDVMSQFTVEMQGDKTKCPGLLSNGNLI